MQNCRWNSSSVLKTALLIVLVAATATLSAQGQGRSNVANRARGSERVVVATIASIEPVAAQNEYGDELIISRTTLAVQEALKGPWTPTLTLDVEGGTLGGLTLEVSDLPSVRPGERGVFFVRRAGHGRNVPHDRGNGLLKLNQNDTVEDSSLTLDVIRRRWRRPKTGAAVSRSRAIDPTHAPA